VNRSVQKRIIQSQPEQNKMKAIQLVSFDGVDGLSYTELPVPEPAGDEVLIHVKAAGINYAEVEQIRGRYLTFGKELPFTMGFEVAGVVTRVGAGVTGIAAGDQVTAMTLSGGFAEYATAKAAMVIPIPQKVSFGEATTLPLQGMTAYTLLKYAVLPYRPETLLIQAAAGGVGSYLVQLAKYLGIQKIIALVGSDAKLPVVRELGAQIAINYSLPGWPSKVLAATGGKGADVVLQMSVGAVGEECFRLIAPGGRLVIFGSKNYHDQVSTEQLRQLIWNNQTLTGFAFPALPPEKIAECVPELLEIVRSGAIRLIARHEYRLDQAREAFLALEGRDTIGKVYLVPA
jgi:NADPH2:quinone reductase